MTNTAFQQRSQCNRLLPRSRSTNGRAAAKAEGGASADGLLGSKDCGFGSSHPQQEVNSCSSATSQGIMAYAWQPAWQLCAC